MGSKTFRFKILWINDEMLEYKEYIVKKKLHDPYKIFSTTVPS